MADLMADLMGSLDPLVMAVARVLTPTAPTRAIRIATQIVDAVRPLIEAPLRAEIERLDAENKSIAADRNAAWSSGYETLKRAERAEADRDRWRTIADGLADILALHGPKDCGPLAAMHGVGDDYCDYWDKDDAAALAAYEAATAGEAG